MPGEAGGKSSSGSVERVRDLTLDFVPIALENCSVDDVALCLLDRTPPGFPLKSPASRHVYTRSASCVPNDFRKRQRNSPANGLLPPVRVFENQRGRKKTKTFPRSRRPGRRPPSQFLGSAVCIITGVSWFPLPDRIGERWRGVIEAMRNWRKNIAALYQCSLIAAGSPYFDKPCCREPLAALCCCGVISGTDGRRTGARPPIRTRNPFAHGFLAHGPRVDLMEARSAPGQVLPRRRMEPGLGQALAWDVARARHRSRPFRRTALRAA